MSLATRCTSCGTVFRVVQDQLKVSEGWVRCGRCDAVFNALEGLFDLERDTPPEWTPMTGHSDASTSAHALPVHELFEIETPPSFEHLGQPEAEFAERAGGAQGADGPLPSHNLSSDPGLIGSGETEEATSDARIERYEDPASAFLRQALQPSHWRSGSARIMLTAVAFVLALGLVGQVVHHFRSLVAARMPVLRPALNAWCAAAGCSIDAARRIEDIAVESSALTRAQGPDTFRFAVTLRNRGAMVIALPSIELSLTDSTGTVLARRLFSPRDFRDAAPRMQTGSESALQVTLETGNSNISGYTVEIFYP